MNKENNANNNIFAWATKELSQDAVVAWLLAGKNGLSFLQNMLGNISLDGLFIKDVITQKESIDILVELGKESDDEYLEAVIIEDKTDTFLHSNQMFKYIAKKCNETKKKNVLKYSRVYYVLFKTGKIYDWEKEEYNRQVEIFKRNEKLEYNDFLDFYGNTRLLLTGELLEKEYKFTIPKNHNEIINIRKDIYSKDDFLDFINGISFKNDIDNKTLDLIKDSYMTENEDYGYPNYKLIEEYLLKNNYITRMILPSGQGERYYAIHIFSDDWFKYPNDLKKPFAIYDNYLIIPIIRWNDDGTLQFVINYSLISNLNLAHGYQSFDKTIDTLKNYVSKEDIVSWKKDIFEYVGRKYGKIPRNPNADNRLQLVSWNVAIEQESIKQNIDLLLEIADEASKFISCKND